MEIVLPIITGIFYSAGLYLMLNRSFIKLIIGLVILGHASNLFIFTVSGLTRGEPPLIAENAKQIAEPMADPVPQALILTAIVIGFGIQAFAIILLKRTYEIIGTDDIDELNVTDKIG